MMKRYKIHTCISLSSPCKLTAIWEEPTAFNSISNVCEFVRKSLTSMHSNTWHPKYMSELESFTDCSSEANIYLEHIDELNDIIVAAAQSHKSVHISIFGGNCLVSIGIFTADEYPMREKVNISIDDGVIETEVVHNVSTDI